MKNELPPGPWQNEPDQLQWRDDRTGLNCLILRNHFGALCGYVGVPAGHQMFGKTHHDVDAHAHGGLTFSDSDGTEWWFGFDCGHVTSGDLLPRWSDDQDIAPLMRTYRDIEFVRSECTHLAHQLWSMA